MAAFIGVTGGKAPELLFIEAESSERASELLMKPEIRGEDDVVCLAILPEDLFETEDNGILVELVREEDACEEPADDVPDERVDVAEEERQEVDDNNLALPKPPPLETMIGRVGEDVKMEDASRADGISVVGHEISDGILSITIEGNSIEALGGSAGKWAAYNARFDYGFASAGISKAGPVTAVDGKKGTYRVTYRLEMGK